MESTQKDFKKKKTTLVLSYVVSIALLGMVALDFLGYAIPLKPLVAHAATYIGVLNSNGGYAPFGCSTGSPRQYTYYPGGGGEARDSTYWWACTQ